MGPPAWTVAADVYVAIHFGPPLDTFVGARVHNRRRRGGVQRECGTFCRRWMRDGATPPSSRFLTGESHQRDLPPITQTDIIRTMGVFFAQRRNFPWPDHAGDVSLSLSLDHARQQAREGRLCKCAARKPAPFSQRRFVTRLLTNDMCPCLCLGMRACVGLLTCKMSWFRLPAPLRTKLILGFGMVDNVRKQVYMAGQCMAPTAESISALSSLEIIERQTWNVVPTTGVLQITFDPVSGSRKSLFMNQRFASIFGFHRLCAVP